MEIAAQLAARLHGGMNVYRSRAACLSVLQSVEKARPQWWDGRCSSFVRAVEETSTTLSVPRKHPVLVLEGLDGVGKTTVSCALAKKLDATIVRTPPVEWTDVRENCRVREEYVARAFYSAANYLAAECIFNAAQGSLVIVDRWWCSTCVMALAHQFTMATLPPEGSSVYTWPEDLPQFDMGFVLRVDESIRLARIHRRAPEDAEERQLSARDEMRAVAMEAYRRTHLLQEVDTPTSYVAVNHILEIMRRAGSHYDAKPFTAAELASVSPF